MESEGGKWGLERLDGLYKAQLGGEPEGYWVLLPHVPKEWAGGPVSSDLREGRKSWKAEEKDRTHPPPSPPGSTSLSLSLLLVLLSINIYGESVTCWALCLELGTQH